jgi:hypothetical protein
MPTGAVNEIVDRWPLVGGGGLWFNELLFLTCAIGDFRCLSPPYANPFVEGGCSNVRGGGGFDATFLKVI